MGKLHSIILVWHDVRLYVFAVVGCGLVFLYGYWEMRSCKDPRAGLPTWMFGGLIYLGMIVTLFGDSNISATYKAFLALIMALLGIGVAVALRRIYKAYVLSLKKTGDREHAPGR